MNSSAGNVTFTTRYQRDDLISLSQESREYVVNEFNHIDEVSAEFLYREILKAVKEVIYDDKIDCLFNLNFVLEEIGKIKKYECLTTYQDMDGIRNFNLVSLACKNKAIKVLEYIFLEESQSLFNLSVHLSGVSKNESLMCAMDEFSHNAFYYAIRSNMTDLLKILVEKWQGQYGDEKLDCLLSQSYKELKLRNVSLAIEMQLFVRSKILDLRFFHASTAVKSGTGNSWDQIKKRIEMVVKLIQTIKNDYSDQDPDEKFISIAEFTAKSMHILKSLLKSTYDRLPWEEIEFCLIIFIRCCKYSSKPNLVYNCVLNKNQLLKHLFNFSSLLLTKYDKFENNVIKLAKSVNLPRDHVIEKIVEANSEFRELYDDYEKIRDFYCLEIIKRYADLVECNNATEKRSQLLVSRVLQVMGERLKNTLESPNLSTTTADALLSSLSSDTRRIITALRDSLSKEKTLNIRSEIEKRVYFIRNIQKDIAKIKEVVPDILSTMKIALVKSMLGKVKLCKAIEDIKEHYGPYQHSIDLDSKEIENAYLDTSIKRDFERLKEMVQSLNENMKDKSIREEALFDKISKLIQGEKERSENLKRTFSENFKVFSCLRFCVSSRNYVQIICEKIKALADFHFEAPSNNGEIRKLIEALLETVTKRRFPSKNKKMYGIIWKIVVFMKFEMGSVKWIEEFRDAMCQKFNKKERCQKRNSLSNDKLNAKLSHLREALADFDVKDGTSKADFLSFENNMELRAITEMLVLDILGILERWCCRNPFFLDSDFPVLIGKNLRNYLAHGNTLIDVCLQEGCIQLLVNAKKIFNVVFSKDNEMDSVINCDCFKLQNCLDCDLQIINNQQKLFIALSEGNVTGIEECVHEGADVYGKDYNSSTCLHFAGEAPDITALKWALAQGLDISLKDNVGQTVFHKAAKFNRPEIFQYLVEQRHVSLDIRDANGKTPLHVAVESKNNEVVEYISKLEINTSRKDKDGSTPLQTAIHWNNIKGAEILLEKETNVDDNRSHGNFTALHIATRSENLFLVELLVAKKAGVNLKSDFGLTPLHLSAASGNFEIMNVLVSNGANVNAKDESEITPLLHAVRWGRKEFVDFLIQHGADINVSDSRQLTPLMIAAVHGHASVAEYLLKKGAFINAKDIFGFTPLHFAAWKGHYEVVVLLLNYKASIDCKNNKKETAMHLSVIGGHKEVVKLLLKEGADVNATVSTNSSPIHFAAARGHKDIVDLLIDQGADINCKNDGALTALHYAASNENRTIVESLLKKGANIRSYDANNFTPLYFLIAGGLSDLLTSERRDVNISDDNGFTLLHVAASAGDMELVEYCIENNCDINSRSKSGLTALHLAAQDNNHNIVKFLLSKNAKFQAKNDDGYTPLFFAVCKNCIEAVQILVSHEIQNFKSNFDDKINALQISVGQGYYKIVDLLLQNYEFEISNELRQELMNTAVCFNLKYVVATLLGRGFEINGDAKPLHVSVRRKNNDMVYFLLTNGADPNILDKDNNTPLEIAVQLEEAEIVEILFSENAVIRIESKYILSAAEQAVKKNQLDIIKLLLQMEVIEVNDKRNSGCALLHISAFYGSLDVTKYLVAQGANINTKDNEGRKPVHLAAEKGFKDMVEFYLNCDNLGDETAALLLVAVSFGQETVCELLINRNADVNCWYVDDENLINLAVKKDHKEVLSVLLNYGIYYNTHPPSFFEDNDAASLLRKVKKLFTAVQRNKPSDVENLLKGESNSEYCLANAKCMKKQTVLHYASWKGYEKIVDVLLKHNTNPNARNKTGNTPLHYAVKFSHFGVVKALLSKGAIYNALAQTGKTPLDYATDQVIGYFLLFLHRIFTKVQNNDVSVRENLIGKDEDVMRAVIRAKNRERKTLLDVAYISYFHKTEHLERLFETDLVLDLKRADEYLRENKYHETALVYKKILSKKIAIFGVDSQPVLDVKVYLAVTFRNLGDLDKALDLFQKVYESRKNSLGEEHQKTLLEKSCIALLLLEKGKTEESLRIYEAIYVKLKGKLKPDDLNMITFKNGYSRALFAVKKFEKVLKINYEIQKKIELKNDHEHRILLAESFCITAVTLAEQQKLVQAKELLGKAYEIRINILPPQDPDTLKVLSEIAKVLSRLGMYDESLKIFKEVLAIKKSHLPADHVDILDSEYQVGAVLCRQEMFLSALKIFLSLEQIFLSLEQKIAAASPMSNLMKKNNRSIEILKYEISKLCSEGLFDEIRNQIIKSRGN